MRTAPALLAACLFLASCASAPDPSPRVLQRLSAAGVESRTCSKIQSGRVLSYGDILGLVQHKVSDAVIVSYLKSTHAPYRFTDSQLGKLGQAGAGSQLINYLGQSVGYYEATKRSQTGGTDWDKHPYFNDPGYWGPAPFPYAFPGEWADPGFIGMY